MGLVRVTPPSTPAISLDEAKGFLVIETDAHDGLLAAMIASATADIDGDSWFGQALVSQEWKFVIDAFPDDILRIPLPPLQSVTSVKYIDDAGDTQTLDQESYRVVTSTKPGFIEPAYGCSWPSTRDVSAAVEVQFKAGYGATPSAVPAHYLAYIRLLLAKMWEFRSPIVTGTIVSEVQGYREMISGDRIRAVYPS